MCIGVGSWRTGTEPACQALDIGNGERSRSVTPQRVMAVLWLTSRSGRFATVQIVNLEFRMSEPTTQSIKGQVTIPGDVLGRLGPAGRRQDCLVAVRPSLSLGTTASNGINSLDQYSGAYGTTSV